MLYQPDFNLIHVVSEKFKLLYVAQPFCTPAKLECCYVPVKESFQVVVFILPPTVNLSDT